MTEVMEVYIDGILDHSRNEARHRQRFGEALQRHKEKKLSADVADGYKCRKHLGRLEWSAWASRWDQEEYAQTTTVEHHQGAAYAAERARGARSASWA